MGWEIPDHFWKSTVGTGIAELPGIPDAHVEESVIPVQRIVMEETRGAEKLKQDFLIFNFVF